MEKNLSYVDLCVSCMFQFFFSKEIAGIKILVFKKAHVQERESGS